MADSKDDIVLSIRGMSKSFGRNRVLDHINLDVKRGTVMGLMGENGAGKSTMMKCLFGTYQKDEGKIYLNGKEISFSGPKDALENGIAMVHQELNQCLERNVIDNLFLGRYPTNSMGVVDEGSMKKKAADRNAMPPKKSEIKIVDGICLSPSGRCVRSPRQFPTMRR